MDQSVDKYDKWAKRIDNILELRYDRDVTGQENIPEVPALYATNHLRMADSFLISSEFYHQTGIPMRFGAKQEYFDGGGLNDKGLFGGTMQRFVEETRQIPVDRDNPRAFVAFRQHVTDVLKSGDSVGLHPEGTRSPDGRLYKFRSGLASIALKALVPVVPVGITYTRRSMIHSEAHISFGEPILPEEYTKLGGFITRSSKRPELLSALLAERVQLLTDQEYVDEFATRKAD